MTQAKPIKKMKKTKVQKSWVEQKLTDSVFRAEFLEEIERISIGEQLVRMRLAAGLTQAEVAKRIGSTPSAISRYESAQYDRYELRTLRRITEACGGRFHLILEAPHNSKRVKKAA